MLDYLKIILIGIIEGITEWLPVSSTGHILLLERFFPIDGMSDTVYQLFLYVIQAASILAVLVLFFSRLWPFFVKKPEQNKKTWRLWGYIIIGILPAAIVGILLDDWVDEHIVTSSFGPYVVAAALIVYGVLYIVIERTLGKKELRVKDVDSLTKTDAFSIGLFQCLSVIPGTSRSGSTILGGMLLGVSRLAAAEYSFFMALPVVAGAAVIKVGKFAYRAFEGEAEYVLSSNDVGYLLVGSLVSFIVSFAVIRFLMDFVRRHSFEAFGWYRIALGVAVLLLFHFTA